MKGYSQLSTKITRNPPKLAGYDWYDMPNDCMGEVIETSNPRIIPIGAVIVHCLAGLVVLGDTIRSWPKNFRTEYKVRVRLMEVGETITVQIKERTK